MMFTKRLRPRIVSGEIDCSVRIWRSPRVKVGGRYPLEGGQVVVEKIREIGLSDITPQLARRSGFEGVVDLLKVARHGAGTHVYLVDFHYEDAA
ncbi:MAG: hypothetical protein J7498_13100 [Sphingobium sp.]|nr:hypothetical protein [Sphingobium sp.]